MNYSVNDVMRIRHSLVVPESATIREVAERLIVSDCDLVFATDSTGRLCGVLAESSIVRALISPSAATLSISSIVTRHVESLSPSAPLSAAVPLFRTSASTAIPVVDGRGCVVGVLMRRDVMMRLLHFRVDPPVPATESPQPVLSENIPAAANTAAPKRNPSFYQEKVSTGPQKNGSAAHTHGKPHFFRGEDARRILWASEDRL